MRLSIEIAVTGVIISIAVYRFACVHMRYKPATDRKLLRNMLRGIRYAFILIWETSKANVAVFRIVFSRTIEIEPRLIYFRTNLRTNVARVALANSITLTPGTITVALNDGLFCVHCLSGKMAEGLEDSVFIRELQKFEG
jgi:multicomponent Na+:H+ antiporter subunit E